MRTYKENKEIVVDEKTIWEKLCKLIDQYIEWGGHFNETDFLEEAKQKFNIKETKL